MNNSIHDLVKVTYVLTYFDEFHLLHEGVFSQEIDFDYYFSELSGSNLIKFIVDCTHTNWVIRSINIKKFEYIDFPKCD